MILSVSRRTDIPAFYLEWFCKRLTAGHVLVRNPFNANQVSKIALHPEVVDGIVFWSKNPVPLLSRLECFQDYPYYLQFTLNPYAADIEPCLPDKAALIQTFQALSVRIGPDRVLWRYDPVLLNPRYTLDYHIAAFEKLAQALQGYTRQVTFSFLDFYRKIGKNVAALAIQEPTSEQKQRLAQAFAEIARAHQLSISTCAERIDLSAYGIEAARCIDGALLEGIGGYPLQTEKDKNQRPECGCATAVDIGAYNTCQNGCLYCYANYSRESVLRQSRAHDPDSPLLIGEVSAADQVRVRELRSQRVVERKLF